MAKRNAAAKKPATRARKGGKSPASRKPAETPKRRSRARRVMLWVAIVGLVVLGVLALIWAVAPREQGRLTPPEIAELPEDLDAWLYAQEAGVPPEVARRIVWAGRPAVKTPVALVYLHGFSASSQEIRPVPDLVAAWQGANLYFARLSGHGLDGPSMGKARVSDWSRDVAEAIAIGRRIGEKVVVIGTSTGGTLAALAARDPKLGPQIDGVVLVSPNFGLQARGAFLLRQPLARYWLPIVGGQERCFEPLNDAQRAYWTTCYPTESLVPMAALVAEAARTDFAAAAQPMLAIWSDDDHVVDPAATRAFLSRWGGEVTRAALTMSPGDDPASHVIAGDIMSPGQTAPVATTLSRWLAETFPE